MDKQNVFLKPDEAKFVALAVDDNDKKMEISLDYGTGQSLAAVLVSYQDWSISVFDTTALAACKGLEREVKELKTDIDNGAPAAQFIIEAADVLFYLVYILKREGITIEQLCKAMETKLNINKGRIWIKNTDGTFSHLK